ncbi:MAG: M43 family zinc metalloprotease, partial [Bacteroidia bacterium]|nr:M43 family zinc metalloprotease [Bacteroidia bacterium]
MKHTIFFIIVLLLNAFVFAQNIKKCATAEMMEKWFSENPDKKAAFLEQRRLNLERSQDPSFAQNQKTSATVYTIPVVFHILHVGGSENISNAQVMDAVNIMTRDFRKKNPDTVAIQTVFKNLAADVQIEFVLATKDPNGNCTNGIIRHYDPKTLAWNGDPNDYIYTWPPHKYLNIYVVKNITFNAAGYTFYPGTVGPSMDVIVVLSNYVGSIGTSIPFNSRVLTHEVGHWLDLEHVWGNTNNPGVSCGDDGIFDTPVTKGWNNCNLNSNDVCTPGIKENVENYMEYAYCSKMFTTGQANHMKSIIQNNVGNRLNLVTATNL